MSIRIQLSSKKVLTQRMSSDKLQLGGDRMKKFLTESDIKEGKEFAEMFGKLDKLGKLLTKAYMAGQLSNTSIKENNNKVDKNKEKKDNTKKVKAG